MHPIRTDITFVPFGVHTIPGHITDVTEGTKPSLSAYISDMHRDQILKAICNKFSDLCRQRHSDPHICALYTYAPKLCDTVVHAIVPYRKGCAGSNENFEHFLVTARDIMSPGRRAAIVRAKTQC